MVKKLIENNVLYRNHLKINKQREKTQKISNMESQNSKQKL